MNEIDINSLEWQKMNGLLPVIVQNAESGQVLMLGYMNQEALIATLTSGQLNLYSRSRQRLWRKGEHSGNSMAIQHISADRDNDSLLVQVKPKGTIYHEGYITRYQPPLNSAIAIIDELIHLVDEQADTQDSTQYTLQLLDTGIEHCAQKLGEKAITTVIAAINTDTETLIHNSAELLFHLLILMKACDLNFYDVLSYMKTELF